MNNLSIAQNTSIREPIANQSEGRWGLSQLLHNWNIRRKVKRLQDYDNRLLDDIGVTRDELSWAGKLPLSANAALALEDRAYRRRKEQRHMWL